ncbi:hypothetical protein [Lysobacter auxotrophicus]|uniref:Uncharacterized protein n=1 Tax=Lysobacter auxotrophicus TaxID=2992573 RepID=A0ABM8DIH0_9GAMM|nr:hypothetical protein [Lysobacter auxotrophicus]BDU18448.1 hypothetical protein LA521A_36490 [Lysobacter auxotrophicus]
MRDIDQIESTLVVLYPKLKVTQLKVLHPGADDDGLWFFSHPDCDCEVQLEAPTRNCPFLLESGKDDQGRVVTTVDQAIDGVVAKLGLPPAR